MIRGSRAASLVLLTAALGCGSDRIVVTQPPPPLQPRAIEIASGDGQGAPVNGSLQNPLVVRVTDVNGRGVPQVTVEWQTIPGGGTTNADRTVTDDRGMASVIWTLGTVVGEERLTAAVAGTQALTVTFRADAQYVPPAPPPPRPIVLHYDGAAWTPSLVLPAGLRGTAIWGLGPSQVYAGIYSCPDIVTYSNGSWQSSSCEYRQIYGIWGPAPDNLYAIEHGLGRPLIQPQYIYHFDGSTWNIVYTNPGSDLAAISGRGTTELFAVGKGGHIVRLLGSNWTEQTSGTTNDLLAVWGDPAGGAAVAVGSGGTILSNDGSNWVAQTSGTTQQLNGVWGTSAHDIFAVGANGTILHYDGTAWSPQASGTTKNLNAVWAGSNGAVAVGDDGTILRYDGAAWSAQSSGVTTNLIAVWGSSMNDIFVVSQ